MKKVCLSLLMGLMVQMTFGQTLEKMQWFNEPEQWEVKNNVLSMSVTPQSDYWRISHYGFTVDDAPFYYATYGGEFEAKVKVVGEYKERFDQAGLMLRIDHGVRAEPAHERRADARQIALGQIRVAVEQIVRRHHAEHGVAQKLQPLVAAEAAAVLVGVGAVVERALEQLLVFKRVIQPFFQRMHFFSYAPLSNS